MTEPRGASVPNDPELNPTPEEMARAEQVGEATRRSAEDIAAESAASSHIQRTADEQGGSERHGPGGSGGGAIPAG